MNITMELPKGEFLLRLFELRRDAVSRGLSFDDFDRCVGETSKFRKPYTDKFLSTLKYTIDLKAKKKEDEYKTPLGIVRLLFACLVETLRRSIQFIRQLFANLERATRPQ